MKRSFACIVIALALAPAALLAHIPIVSVFTLPPCIDGAPFAVWVTDSDVYQGCSPAAAGQQTRLCLCVDGDWRSIAAADGVFGGQAIYGGLELLLGASSEDPDDPLLTLHSEQYITLAASATGGLVELFDLSGDGLQAEFELLGSATSKVVVNTSGGEVARIDATGIVGTDAGLRIGDSATDANAVRLTRDSSDKLCHDTDADGSCEAGEHLVSDGVESLWVSANEMYGIAGTATPGVVGTLHVYQGLPDSATTEVGGWVALPASLRGRSFAVKLLYAESSVGSACNFRVTSEAKAIEAGTSIGSGGTTKTSSIARPSTSTSNLTAYATLDSSFATTASTVAIAVSVERLGSDGLDTCTSVLRVLGLELEIL